MTGSITGSRGTLRLDCRDVSDKIGKRGAVAELADAEDLKSSGGDTLWVQVPPAPLNTIYGGIMV
jgi:hypothetical protein